MFAGDARPLPPPTCVVCVCVMCVRAFFFMSIRARFFAGRSVNKLSRRRTLDGECPAFLPNYDVLKNVGGAGRERSYFLWIQKGTIEEVK